VQATGRTDDALATHRALGAAGAEGMEGAMDGYLNWLPLGRDQEGLNYPGPDGQLGDFQHYWRHFHTADPVARDFIIDPLANVLGQVGEGVLGFERETGIPELAALFGKGELEDARQRVSVSSTFLHHQFRLNPKPLNVVAFVFQSEVSIHFTAWKRDPKNDTCEHDQDGQTT
jgi:hypothetical protein